MSIRHGAWEYWQLCNDGQWGSVWERHFEDAEINASTSGANSPVVTGSGNVVTTTPNSHVNVSK